MTIHGRGSVLRMTVLALLWGSSFLWIKLALNHGLTPLQITVTRCLLGAGVLLGIARAAHERLPRDLTTWGHLVVAALFCNALPFFLFGVAEQTVDSGVAGALSATTPLWSLLIGLAIGTERGLRPVRLGGLLLGFAGTLLIFAPWHEDGLLSWAALTPVGAAASYAIAFAYMGRWLTGNGRGPFAVSAAQLMTAAAMSALALPADGGAPLSVNPKAVVAVAILGVLSTGVTFYLNYRIIAEEGATNAAIVGYLLPVVSLALGAFALGEHLGLRAISGMVVVLVGVSMTRCQGRTRPQAVAQEPAALVSSQAPGNGRFADNGRTAD